MPILRRNTILAGLLMLMVFYPLVSCASPGVVRGTANQVTTDATATRAAEVPERPVQWKLVWSDEFNGPPGAPPDKNKWMADTGGGGWGNEQLEYDTFF